MKRLSWLIFFVLPLGAQIPAPQIGLTGNIGCQGFPCVNNGTLVFTSDADHTMTARETSAFYIKVTSSVPLTAARNLVSPLGNFPFTIENATTGGQSIQIIGASGTGIIIPNGSTVSVWNDGTNYVQSGGGAARGDLSGTYPNPTVAKVNGGAVPASAGVLASNSSSQIVAATSANIQTALGFTPYNATNPAGYITPSALTAYLPLSGGTLTGTLNGTSASFSGTVAAMGAVLSSTILPMATGSTDPIVADDFGRYAAGTTIQGLTVATGNSQWLVTGAGTIPVTVATTIPAPGTPFGYLTTTDAGGTGTRNYYAFLNNTATLGGTPQPVHRFGATFRVCGPYPGTPTWGNIVTLAATSGLAIANLVHLNIQNNQWGLIIGPNVNGLLTLSSIARSGGIVTAVTSAPLTISIGDPVSVSNVADTSFNGVFTLTGVSGTTLTYTQAGANATSSGGYAGTYWITSGYFSAPLQADCISEYSAEVSLNLTPVGGNDSFQISLPDGSQTPVISFPSILLPSPPTDIFLQDGSAPGNNQGIWGRAWIGQDTSSKLAGAGSAAPMAVVQTLNGSAGSARVQYPTFTIPNAAGGGGTGWYRIATAATYGTYSLIGDFTVSDLSSGSQILKFHVGATNSAISIAQTSNDGSASIIDQVRVSTDGASNIGLDIHISAAFTTYTHTISILGVGQFTPAIAFPVGASPYGSQALFTAIAVTQIPSPTLAGGIGWYTIVSQNSGSLFPLNGISGELIITATSSIGYEIFGLTANGIAGSGCTVSILFTNSQGGSLINALRCSWNGTNVQLDVQVPSPFSSSYPVTLTYSPVGNFNGTFNSSPTVGATVLSSGSNLVNLLDPQFNGIGTALQGGIAIGPNVVVPKWLTSYTGLDFLGTAFPTTVPWSTPSAVTPVCHNANGNLTDAGCALPTKSGTPTVNAGVCWKTASVLGTCTAGTWPNCTTCN